MRWPIARLSLTAVALGALTAAGPSLHLAYGGWALMAIFAASGLGILLALQAGNGPDQRNALVVILCRGVAMRLALLFVEPYLSTDIYRYIWDGRVQAAGINPYRYVPSAPELAHLRDAAIFPQHQSRRLRSDDLSAGGAGDLPRVDAARRERAGHEARPARLRGGDSGRVLLALLRRLGSPATRIAAYAWHPLPVWEIAGSGHVDAAMCALLMAGLLLFLRGRIAAGRRGGRHAGRARQADRAAGAARVLAAVGLAVAGRGRRSRRVAAYLPYLSVGAGVLGFLCGLYRGGGSGFRPRLQDAVAGGAHYWACAHGRCRLRRPRRCADGLPALAVGLPHATGLHAAPLPASAGCWSSS